MSSNQSCLSNTKYNYDFVVAATQESINRNLKAFIGNNTFPRVRRYWNQDKSGNPVEVSYDELMQQTNGTNPLDVPTWEVGNPETQEIKNITNSNFFFAFEASIGLLSTSQVPSIVTLNQESQTVEFNLTCSTFNVVTCNFGRHGLLKLLNVSQTAESPWMFTSIIQLKNIINNNNLPANVRKQLDNFGPNAFSVQQLYLDLDTAALQSVPTITGVKPGTAAYAAISQVFVGAYFTEMKKNGHPVLNYTIKKNNPGSGLSASLPITDMTIEVSNFKGSTDYDKLNTLDYLCMTNGHELPEAVPFSWNWIEPDQSQYFDGIISINRNTLANYFAEQLSPLVSPACILPWTKVEAHALGSLNLQWNLAGNQSPTLSIKPTDRHSPEVMTLSYFKKSSASDKSLATYGEFDLQSSYNCSVSFSGSKIIIEQHLVIYLYFQWDNSAASGNIVDKTITDAYQISINPDGRLVTSPPAIFEKDESQTPTNWVLSYFTNFQDCINHVRDYAKQMKGTNLKNLPLDFPQQFVFPGGNTFAYRDVQFSDFQDLISHITYLTPAN